VIKILPSLIYFLGLAFAEILRLPLRINRIRNHQQWNNLRSPFQVSEYFVVASVILGIWVLPIIYFFTDYLHPYDYSLPPWATWFAIGIFLISTLIRWSAQRTLDRHWSYTLETREGHALVKTGIYSFTRHPIYVSLILWAIAQPILLMNFIAGFGGAVAVALIWIVRVPREEQMMIELFGEEYRRYMAQTGIFFPKKPPKESAL